MIYIDLNQEDSMEPVKIPPQGSEPSPLTEENKDKDVLPTDVKELIFSYLEDKDFVTTIQVSPSFKAITLELSKNELKLIESFVNWLMQKLDNESMGKNELIKAMEGTKIFDDSIKLSEIKSSTQELLQQVLSIVGGLNEEEISNLETLVKKEHKPSFFETLLKLAPIEHDLEDANKLDDSWGIKSGAFNEISNRLTALGQYDKALDVALKMKFGGLETIKNVIEHVIKSSNIKKASEMINKIVEVQKTHKISVLLDIFKIFEKNNNWEQVFEIINLTIPELPTTLDQMIFDDETTFLDSFIEGIELSKKEPDFISKTPSFATLVGSLALAFSSSSENPEIDNILKTIPSSVLYDISVKLVESGLKFKAFAVMQRIDDPDYQERVSDLRKLMAG